MYVNLPCEGILLVEPVFRQRLVVAHSHNQLHYTSILLGWPLRVATFLHIGTRHIFHNL